MRNWIKIILFGILTSILSLFVRRRIRGQGELSDYSYGFPIKYMETMFDVGGVQINWTFFFLNTLILIAFIFIIYLSYQTIRKTSLSS